MQFCSDLRAPNPLLHGRGHAGKCRAFPRFFFYIICTLWSFWLGFSVRASAGSESGHVWSVPTGAFGIGEGRVFRAAGKKRRRIRDRYRWHACGGHSRREPPSCCHSNLVAHDASWAAVRRLVRLRVRLGRGGGARGVGRSARVRPRVCVSRERVRPCRRRPTDWGAGRARAIERRRGGARRVAGAASHCVRDKRTVAPTYPVFRRGAFPRPAPLYVCVCVRRRLRNSASFLCCDVISFFLDS